MELMIIENILYPENIHNYLKWKRSAFYLENQKTLSPKRKRTLLLRED